jgi:aminoglycoside phosphotransferase (APT) family kinase protein
MRVHADELDIDEPLVRALLSEQFPGWADMPLERAGDGTVNVIYRLGEELAVRMPRREGPEDEEDVEFRWLPVLAPHLPVAIPRPVARGRPGSGYPWFWSVHTWLEGDLPTGPMSLADVADFVGALQQIETAGAPEPGYGRGRPLASRERHVRAALERIDAPGALELWEGAAATPEWDGERVWIHADLDRRNVLVRGGRLVGVLDWGGVGVGDPAVDATVAWKLLDPENRARFRELAGFDDATWLRAQGWVLSQALVALGYYTLETNPAIVAEATRWLSEVLAN